MKLINKSAALDTRWQNKALIGVVLAFLLSGFLAVAGSSPQANAARGAFSVLDDNCYSTLSVTSQRGGNIAGMIGRDSPLQFGLVNAIVRVPIYDWDQQKPSWLQARDIFSKPATNPVGYAKVFTFRVIPVPNTQWIDGFIRDPANTAMPLLYQQGAIVDGKTGIPKFPAIRSIFGMDKGMMGGGGLDSIGAVPGVTGAEDGAATNSNQGTMNQIIRDRSSYNPNSILNGALNLISQQYTVDGSNPNDNCHEYLNASSKRVPAYAFSVVNPAAPISFFGSFYSLITLWQRGQLSFAGFTAYFPLGVPTASANGKDMLDCYGRNVTPSVRLDNTSIGNVPLSGRGDGRQRSFEIAVKALAYAADVAALSPVMGPIPALFAATAPANWKAQNMMMPIVYDEKYFNGFTFMFALDTSKPITLVDTNGNELKNREVDWKSPDTKTVDFDVANWANTKPFNHGETQNAKAFFTDLSLKLKKPYHLTPSVTQNGSAPTRTPDGQPVKLDINVHKGGYDKGTSHSNPYTPSVTNGGPTRADDGRYFSRARVMKITVNPGTASNPIKNPTDRGDGFFGYKNDFAPWFDGGKDSICRFWREKLGVDPSGGDDKTKDCDQVSEEGIDMPMKDLPRHPDNINDKIISSIEFTIPPETPPGTKYCYAVYIDSYTNDIKYKGTDYYNNSTKNYNKDYSAPSDTRLLSRAYCVISGYKPSFQVRGGDLFTQGGVYTTVNIKERLPEKPAGSKEMRAYGSWAEYGAIVSGPIKNLGTGALYRPGFEGAKPDNRGYLSFSNKYNGSNPAFGYYKDTINDGFDGIVDRFSTRRNNAKEITVVGDANCYDISSKTIYLDGCKSGDYLIPARGFVYKVAMRNPAADVEKNKSLVFMVENGAKLNITTDIKTPSQYSSVSEISQVVFTPAVAGNAYLLNINDTVRRVDAWMLNPSGAINTCLAEGGGLEDTPRSKNQPDGTPNACYQNQLAVNGPVSAKFLYLRRSGGQDQDPNGGTTLHSIPGEMFNLRADAYLWAANQMNMGGTKFVTQDEQILPERF